jgi:hypothetical protein
LIEFKDLTLSATSSLSHFGVEVAPHIPTVRMPAGKGVLISEACVINTE